MKTKLFTLLFALLSASGLFAWDYGHVQIGDLYYNLDATTRIAAVTSEIYYGLGGDNYASLSGAVVIPSSVTYDNIQYSVTCIADHAFYYCTGLTSITIPESVTSLEDWVFSGCTGLTSINIPDKVTRIGNGAFDWCTSLTSINIPESVTSIGEGVFRGCTGLTSITIAAGNTVYDSRNNCNAIIETATNTLIQGCNGTIIPESVTSIGSYAFRGCTDLTSITIPESVTSIGYHAFEDCTGLTSIVWNARNYSDGYAFDQIAPQIVSFTLGSNVENIPSNLCSGMSKLTSITIPENVTSIGYHAFEDCTGLTSIVWNARNYSDGYAFDQIAPQIVSFTLGSNVENIPSNLCSGMSKLTSITIPENVTSIGYGAFDGCTGLTSIVWNVRNYSDDYTSEFDQIAPQIVSFTLGSNVENIPSNLCSGMSKLTSITIPENVTSIESYTFYGCTGLTSITIPESVTSIGNGAFAACSGLTSITVAAGNTVYDSHDNCNAIIETATNKLIAGCKNTVIPNSVTIIGDGAFSECFGLTSITIPNSVTTIEDEAFILCDGLTSVTLGSSLKVIEYGGFAYCENLQTITCYSQRPPTVQEYGLEDVPYSTIIYVPADYLDTYKQHVTWGSYDVRPIDGSAVENVTLQGMRVEAGMLVFGEPVEVSVYTAAGVCVHSGMAERLQLPSGVYTVRCGNAACKTLIP